MINSIYKLFQLKKYNTTIKTEFIAGLTTFFGGAFILFVNPLILSETGMDKGSVFLATILSACIGTLLMALIANLPILIAPGIGSLVWFTFTLVLGMGFSWQQALAATFLGGLFFILFTVTKLRTYLINAFSDNLKFAIGAGIGLFVTALGLKMGGLVAPSAGTIMTLGNTLSIPFIMTLVGVVLIGVLEHYRVKGSLLIVVFILSIVGLIAKESSFSGIISTPPSLSPTFFQLDFSRLLEMTFFSACLAVFLMDFLDGTGTFMSLLNSMGSDIKDKRVKKGLLIDGIATSIGAVFGTATNAAYIESSAGIKAGGRTGLTAVFIAMFFAIAIFFSPLLTLIPSWATAPVLIYIGSLMFKSCIHIKWDDISDGIPAFLIIIIMPLTSSIVHGIGIGVTTWIIINIITRNFVIKKHGMLLFIAIGYIFILYNN